MGDFADDTFEDLDDFLPNGEFDKEKVERNLNIYNSILIISKLHECREAVYARDLERFKNEARQIQARRDFAPPPNPRHVVRRTSTKKWADL